MLPAQGLFGDAGFEVVGRVINSVLDPKVQAFTSLLNKIVPGLETAWLVAQVCNWYMCVSDEKPLQPMPFFCF